MSLLGFSNLCSSGRHASRKMEKMLSTSPMSLERSPGSAVDVPEITQWEIGWPGFTEFVTF